MKEDEQVSAAELYKIEQLKKDIRYHKVEAIKLDV
jgi:hypothetical protein